ncbi:MAG: alpha/beta hydrolase [Bdellovibrionales bacterium]|nr:alpha/beta hydrolase [Bdellovibrionales bacterium]
MMILLKTLVAAVAIGYTGLILLIYFKQDKIVFHPEKLSKDHKYEFPIAHEEGFLNSHNDENINYLVFTPQNPRATILYFHGNAGALDGWGFIAAQLAQTTNCRVLIWDFPGFGKSDGGVPQSAAQTQRIGNDLLYLIEQKFPAQPIVLFGRSIGSGMASQLAGSKAVQGLILETPYLSTVRLAKEMMPWAPSALLKLKLNNTNLKDKGPDKILILHGTRDAVIPYHHSKELATLLGKKSQLITIEGGGHNNLLDFTSYWPEILLYLDQRLSI